MADLPRLVKRLSVLGPAEVLYRARETVRLKTWERRYKRGDLARAYSGLRSADYGFCTAREPRLPEPSFFPLEDAAAVVDGFWPALGFGWRWSPGPGCWFQAPDTGGTWPDGFFHSIPYRAGNPTGDVRVAWEPARLQQLVALARVAHADGALKERALDLLQRQLLSWVEHNPPAQGIHYISVMECALRILAVTHALDLVRPLLPAEAPAWPACAGLVQSHADLIMDRLSLFSSTGNHTVSECVGLVYAGVLFPEMDGAGAWRETGLDILSREAEAQVLSDGGGIERSPWYHLLVVDLLGLTEALLTFHRRAVPPAVAGAVDRGRTFLAAWGSRPQDLPALNDADHGHALSPDLRLSWSKPSDPAPLQTFSQTGFTRVALAADPGWNAVLDHGPLANPPLYAHGHADACALAVQLAGKPVAVDPGTYMYTGGSTWRTYFRSTAAHNTVTVDESDQAQQAAAFQWSKPYRAMLDQAQRDAAGTVFLLCRHDGYASRKVLHRRGVLVVPGSLLLVRDVLEGSGDHRLDLHWHLAGDPVTDGTGVRLDGFPKPVTITFTGGDVSTHRGETDPVCGWASSRYGRKHPITTVRVTHRGPLPHVFQTVFHFGDPAVSAQEYLAVLESRVSP